MKKAIIALCLIFVLTTQAHAGEWFTWDDTNTKLHVPLTLLMVADLGQTLWAQEHYWPTGQHEQNQILGEYPSRGEIWNYFAVSYSLVTAITYALPDKYSHGFQGGIITMEVIVINNNYGLGIGVKF